MAKHNSTHGLSRTPEYQTFSALLRRCMDSNDKFYNDYGGRGIKVCQEWNHLSKFPAFLANVGRKPTPKHTIDRIDHNGNYEPGNVRWATMAEQMRNTRRTHFLTINGETLCLMDWAIKYNIPRRTLALRLERGWSPEDAVKFPLGITDGCYRLRHLTTEQRHERSLEQVREWHKKHPDKMKAYAEERIKRNAAKGDE